MPCSDGGPSREDIERERHRQRGLAVGLCIACAELERLGSLPPVLAGWYAAHLEADEARDSQGAASVEFDQANKQAQQDGYAYIGEKHPLRLRVQRAYRVTEAAEQRERDETVKLSALKPETRR